MSEDWFERIKARWKDSDYWPTSIAQANSDIRRLLSHISTLEAKVKELKDTIDSICNGKAQDRSLQAESRIKELESDLQLNASMLSKQCDLAREAETERDHLSRLLIEERVRTVKLRDAIGKHEKFIRSRNWVVSLEDEELYAYLKEVVEK